MEPPPKLLKTQDGPAEPYSNYTYVDVFTGHLTPIGFGLLRNFFDADCYADYVACQKHLRIFLNNCDGNHAIVIEKLCMLHEYGRIQGNYEEIYGECLQQITKNEY